MKVNITEPREDGYQDIDVNIQNNKLNIPLVLAIKNNQEAIVELLLNNKIFMYLSKNINSMNYLCVYFSIFSEDICSLAILPSFNISAFFANFITAGS